MHGCCESCYHNGQDSLLIARGDFPNVCTCRLCLQLDAGKPNTSNEQLTDTIIAVLSGVTQ